MLIASCGTVSLLIPSCSRSTSPLTMRCRSTLRLLRCQRCMTPEVRPMRNSTIPSTMSRKVHKLGREVADARVTSAYIRAVLGTSCCSCIKVPLGTSDSAPEYRASWVMMDLPWGPDMAYTGYLFFAFQLPPSPSTQMGSLTGGGLPTGLSGR